MGIVSHLRIFKHGDLVEHLLRLRPCRLRCDVGHVEAVCRLRFRVARAAPAAPPNSPSGYEIETPRHLDGNISSGQEARAQHPVDIGGNGIRWQDIASPDIKVAAKNLVQSRPMVVGDGRRHRVDVLLVLN